MTLRVHLIGTGLIGGSVGLALRRAGWPVTVEDLSPTSAALARDLGVGLREGDLTPEPVVVDPELVVVAVPPDATAEAVAAALTRFPGAVVTDVASVKGAVLAALRRTGAELSRYCGSHPMAGRERSGAISARADLFQGRSWVVTPTAETSARARDAVTAMATAAGAAVTELRPDEHDRAVAAVSHVPQVVASLVAARLREIPESSVALAGQGVRDVTRIAASDPGLWTQILAANPQAVRDVLDRLADDLALVRSALDDLARTDDPPGARGILAGLIANGNEGQARIPGKHGAAPTSYAIVRVLIPDEPGQLGRLFQDVGDTGTNIEEFTIDHGLGAQFGLAEVSVVPAAALPLAAALEQKGWILHD